MKKDLEWLKEEVMSVVTGSIGLDFGTEQQVEEMFSKVEQPDITHEQALNKLTEKYPFSAPSIEAILEGHAVSGKYEPTLPEIPDYVAEWIDTNKEKYDLVQLFWEIGEGGLVNLDVDRWIEENPNTFARAWLDGYTVEEKKYVVPLGELHALCKLTYDTVDIYKEDSDKLHLDDDFIFTEQEIKDYDPRYWAFAKEVTE